MTPSRFIAVAAHSGYNKVANAVQISAGETPDSFVGKAGCTSENPREFAYSEPRRS